MRTSHKMMLRRAMTCACAAAPILSCTSHSAPLEEAAPAPSAPLPIKEWQAIARPQDVAVLEALTTTWAAARSGLPARVMKRLHEAGALLDPLAILDLPALSPGPYRCRLFRLGGQQGYAVFAPNTCYVEAGGKGVSLTKQNGVTLVGGWLYPDTDHRLVFLGTVRDKPQLRAPPYGEVAARDVVGIVERVAPFRWRLVLTRAAGQPGTDIYELVPIVAAGPATGG